MHVAYRLILGFVIACAASAAPAAEREPSEVMSFRGAEWLEREGREAEQQPEAIIKAMDLQPGDVIADIGVGTGYFARRIARALGPEGKVYGVDIQPEMLDLLKEYSAEEGLENVIPVLGDDDDPKLEKESLDWILLVDTYHEFHAPKKMLAKMREALKPDGKIALIEYRLLGETATHIKEDHRMSVEQVLREWNPAGFELEDLQEFLPTQHFFVFQKDPCVCDRSGKTE